MLLSLVKKSFKQIMENSSIVLFLVSYLIVLSFIPPLARTGFLMVSLGICSILLTIVFFSGWLQLINSIAQKKDDKEKPEEIEIKKEKGKEEKNVFSIFFEGVGRNFVSLLIATIFYFIVMGAMLYFTGMIANHFFGDINIILKDLMAQASENNNIVELISSLPTEKQYTLYGWQFCLIAASCILGFIFMMYCPFLINTKSNIILRPFVAFFNSIKFLFKNFFAMLGFYILIYFIYIILSILRTFTDSNMFLSVILLFIYIYFLVSVVMVIFNYYDAKNNSTDGSHGIRENETVDTISKED